MRACKHRKFVDARNVPEYMATSLQIDHEANNRQDSTMAPPCFSAEYGSTHAYGGQVSLVYAFCFPGLFDNVLVGLQGLQARRNREQNSSKFISEIKAGW